MFQICWTTGQPRGIYEPEYCILLLIWRTLSRQWGRVHQTNFHYFFQVEINFAFNYFSDLVNYRQAASLVSLTWVRTIWPSRTSSLPCQLFKCQVYRRSRDDMAMRTMLQCHMWQNLDMGRIRKEKSTWGKRSVIENLPHQKVLIKW